MIALVTPTYNEKENLPVLVEKIFALQIPDLKMVVVDDNSPDGTGDLALELSKKYPISVIRRPEKMGLGTAYAEAFKLILQKFQIEEREYPSPNPLPLRRGGGEGVGLSSSPDVENSVSNITGKRNDLATDLIIQMDADLSHDPAAIPLFLEHIKNHDVVLGSRYIAGGKIENWDFLRRLVSRFGNIYAKAVLTLPYQDLTGGFKCWRRAVLANLDFNKLSSTGYNFQIETTYLAHKAGHKICEVPITFTERKFGASKFNLPIMLEAFWKVLMLRLFS